MFLAFVGTRLLVWGIAWLAFYALKHGDHQVLPSTRPWNLLYHWDALWYGRIVQRGYSYTRGIQSSVDFFPLLPLIIRALRALTGAWTPFAGFLVSNASLLGAAILLRRLVVLDFPSPSRAPERSVWLLLLCPVTFFFSAVYTESLFLLLSLAAVLAVRQGRFALGGLAGLLLTATRANALVIMVPLLWEAFAEPGRNPNDEPRSGILRSRWWLLAVPLGLAGFAAYLHIRFGDALAFAHGQAAFHRELATPWQAISLAADYPLPYAHFFIGTAVVGILLCLVTFWVRLRVSYRLYATAMLIVCMSSTLLESLPRFLSIIFPFYIGIAVATLRSEAAYVLTVAVSSAIMAICLALFACGYFMT